MWCFVSLFLVVITSAIDCLERLVSEMTYYVACCTHTLLLLLYFYAHAILGCKRHFSACASIHVSICAYVTKVREHILRNLLVEFHQICSFVHLGTNMN